MQGSDLGGSLKGCNVGLSIPLQIQLHKIKVANEKARCKRSPTSKEICQLGLHVLARPQMSGQAEPREPSEASEEHLQMAKTCGNSSGSTHPAPSAP